MADRTPHSPSAHLRRAVGPVVIVLTITTLACSGGSLVGNDDDFPLPSGPVSFSHAPVDLAGIQSFIPMGEPNVFPKDHGGFPLSNPYTFPASVPVFAVADGVVSLVSHGTRAIPSLALAPQSNWGREYDDHLLVLRVSTTVKVNYAHLTDWYPGFAAKLPSIPRDEIGHMVSVPVKAGDTLAFVGPHAAMDFSVTDRTLALSFLNSSRYPEDQVFSADVLDYFREPVRSQMLGIAFRQLPPRGGKVDYDVAGRIAGNWFQEGTTSFLQNSRKLAIVYDHLWGERITIADGSPMQDVPGAQGPGAPDVWWVKGNSPRPEDVGVAEGMTRYDLIFRRDLRFADPDDTGQMVQGIMLVEAIAEGRIRVEIFKGVTQASAFTAAAKTYER